MPVQQVPVQQEQRAPRPEAPKPELALVLELAQGQVGLQVGLQVAQEPQARPGVWPLELEQEARQVPVLPGQLPQARDWSLLGRRRHHRFELGLRPLQQSHPR